jgi:RHS repeat-associated protein
LDRDQDTLGRERSTGILPVTNGAAEHSLTYDYDNSGRLWTVTSPAGTFSYTYTAGSSLIASVTGPAHTVTNTWETNRDVLDVKENRIPSTTPPVSSFNYGVNNIGQRTGVETTGLAFDTAPADWVWGYDALGQVISADSPTAAFDRAYEYDQIGNRKKSADGALVTTGTTATVYDLNPLNQYSQISVPSVQSVVPIHDQDGNATAYPLPVAPTTNATLAYDGENRLISVTTGTTTVSYVYDSQSRRIARITDSGTAATIYLYDGWNCLAEYTLHNSSFNLHTSLTWGLDLSGSLQGAAGLGGLLAVNLLSSVSGSSVFFPTYDGNGNVSEYLTASGSIAAHYEYDPFGRTIVATGDNAADFAYRFSTKPRDPATGLYYYGYRWYDPDTGRWPSRDPIEERGGVNLYGFVSNGPVGVWDILGTKTCSTYKDAGNRQLLVSPRFIRPLKVGSKLTHNRNEQVTISWVCQRCECSLKGGWDWFTVDSGIADANNGGMGWPGGHSIDRDKEADALEAKLESDCQSRRYPL